VGKIRDDETEAKKIIQTTEQKCFSFQNVRLKMKPEKLVDKNSNFQRAVDTKCSFDRKPDLQSLTSGITVASECKEVFENLKMLKNLRYIIYFIKDLREINVKSTGARNADFDQFLNNLKKGGESECRYGLYDFEYNHQYEGTTETFIKKEKLFLMSWCPDTAKVRQKVVYSASFDVLKKALVGVQKYIQVLTDLVYNQT
jgi:cofilin